MLRAVLDPNTKRIVYRDDTLNGAANVSLPELSVGPAPQNASSPGNVSQGSATPRAAYPDFLSQLEKDRGLPTGYLAQTRAVESSNGKNLANPNSSARGDFQFITSTARKYGVDVNDPLSSARGAADLAADNARYFQNRFGRTPTGAELYGMHQQGAVGFGNLVDGRAPGGAAQSLNGGAGMSAPQFLSKLRSVYMNAKPDIPGDPTAQRGPTVEAANAANSPLPGAQGPTNQPGSNAIPVAVAPQVQDQKFNGGIVGLLQGGDYTGSGANKDFAGKMGDFTGSSAFTSGVKGLMAALGGGGQSAPVRAPGIQNLPAEDQENRPNLSLMQMLYGQTGGRPLLG
jgi:hypothetical protein